MKIVSWLTAVMLPILSEFLFSMGVYIMATIKQLAEAKTLLDGFLNHSAKWGIFVSSVVKTVFFNRSIGSYQVTRKGKTYNGFNVPVIHINENGEVSSDDPSKHVKVWLDSLWDNTQDGETMRIVLLDYMLSWLTSKASGNSLAGIYFTLRSLQTAKVAYPDSISVVRGELTHESKKTDYDAMINALEYVVDGMEKRIANDPLLSDYYGISRLGKTVKTTTKTNLVGLAGKVEF